MQNAFIAQQKADFTIKETRIRALIYSKAMICASVAAIPIPIADIVVLTPIQIAMVTTIGYFYGIEITKERVVELMGTLGAGVGLREAARQLVKLIPGYGSFVSASVAFTGTVALGEAANLWFKKKMTIHAEELRAIFQNTANKAKEEYNKEYSARQSQNQHEIERLRNDLERGRITKDEFDLNVSQLT
ncbi:GTP-binding protein HSR1-related protein [Candidatus Moduliflexus flocculans]|uniref:GTP-binding protein HSR1-related protein n=1 Tax=Candidatus Moduliflexus flocculans TaxID=1499966 RepID=A0A0S6VSB5_9BACT|nr:GTP-binding protein HSR1-related protein [Candidatus Moduliflexus flocculans]